MKINFRIIVICALILSLFFNGSNMQGGIFSIIYWGASFLAVCELLIGTRSKGNIHGKSAFLNAAVVFIAMSFFCNLISVFSNKEEAFTQLMESMKIELSYLVNILFLALTVGTCSRGEIKKEIRAIAGFTVMLEAIPVTLAAYQSFIIIKKIPFVFSATGYLEWAGRYYTFFMNPNGFSEMIFVGFAMAQFLKLDDAGRRKQSLLTVFQILCFVDLCMTASRGTLVAILASWALYDYILYYGRKRQGKSFGIRPTFVLRRVVLMAISAVTLYYSCNYIPNIIPKNMQQRIAGVLEPLQVHAIEKPGGENNTTSLASERIIIRDYHEHGDDISNARLGYWVYGFKTSAAHPLFGVGLYSNLFISCHNTYITILLAYGIVGFLTFLYMVYVALRYARCNLSKTQNAIERKKFAVIAGCMTGIFVISLTNDAMIFTFEFVNVFVWYFMGYVMQNPSRESL